MSTVSHPDWGYTGDTSPEHWGCLADAYRPCGEGVEQSPVNLTGFVSGGTEPVTFDYTTLAVQARNNGHTVYLDFDPGSGLSVGGRRYELLGVHYHSPGEHLLEGESFAAELHLVHQDASGNLAVVGLLFRLGQPQPGWWKTCWAWLRRPGWKPTSGAGRTRLNMCRRIAAITDTAVRSPRRRARKVYGGWLCRASRRFHRTRWTYCNR